MRMWGVNPKFLCDRHLLGEHVEMHMFVGTILKNKSIKGYIKNNLVDPFKIRQRHDILAIEMLDRGFNHKSPLPLFKPLREGSICIKVNILELKRRCRQCREKLTLDNPY